MACHYSHVLPMAPGLTSSKYLLENSSNSSNLFSGQLYRSMKLIEKKKKPRGLHRTRKSKGYSSKQSGKKVGKEWFSFYQGRCAWRKARVSGKQNDNSIDCRNSRVVSESRRLHGKVCVASIVCRCVLLNSLKMHCRVVLKILPH